MKPRKLTQQEINDRYKLKRAIASARGQAGAAQAKSNAILISARIPYMAVRNQGKCLTCNQPLEPNGDYGVIPHTPRTCPGPAGQVMQ